MGLTKCYKTGGKRECTFLLTSSVIVWVLRVFPPFRHRWAVRADHTIPGWDDLCCQGDGEGGAACSAPHRWSHHFQVSNIDSEICSQVCNTDSEICYAVVGSHIFKLVLCTNTMERKKIVFAFCCFLLSSTDIFWFLLLFVKFNRYILLRHSYHPLLRYFLSPYLQTIKNILQKVRRQSQILQTNSLRVKFCLKQG